ncbi:Thioredoxin [compost metagenome]
MKKLLIYLSIVVVLFGALYVVNLQSSKAKDKEFQDNPYGVSASKLDPMTVKQLNDPNYQNLILPKELDAKIKNKESFFLYYYSSTCSHCQATTPVLVPIQKELGIDVKQYNLQEFNEGWKKYNIQYTPTLVYYKEGKEVERIIGGVPETPGGSGNTPEQYKTFFQKYKS